MAKLVSLLCLSAMILAVTSASESTDAEVVDLQPAGTFDFGIGLGGLGLGGWGWNRRSFIPKSYGWGDGGYIPAYIDGGHYDHHHEHYPEVPLKGFGYGWREPVYAGYGGFDNGVGWGWPAGGGYGGLGPY